LETLNLSGVGAINFGTKLNSGFDTTASYLADDFYEASVQSATLSSINATNLSGALNLGRIAQVDSAKFSFKSGSGSLTTLSLDDTTGTVNGLGVLTSSTMLNPSQLVLNDTVVGGSGGWSFDLSNALVGSKITIDDSTTFTKGALAINLGTNATGTKTVVLHDNVAFGAFNAVDVSFAITGTNGTLEIDGDVDFTLLDDATTGVNAHAAELNLAGIKTIQLDAGATAKMSDAQFAALPTGTTFTGAGQTLLVGNTVTDQATVVADLTQLRGVTAIKIDKILAPGTITMTPEQAAIATIVTNTVTPAAAGAAGATNLSTVTAATWDSPDVLNTGGVADTTTRVAGDFRNTLGTPTSDLSTTVKVNINKSVDLTAMPISPLVSVALKGVDFFVLPTDTALTASPWHDIGLTIQNTDVPNLRVGAAGIFDAATTLEQLNSITVKIDVDKGTTDVNGIPEIASTSFTSTYDLSIPASPKWTVIGNAAAIGNAQLNTDVNDLLARSSSITWEAVGSTASKVISGGVDLSGFLNVADTFKFTGTPDVTTGALVINNFNATAAGANPADKLNLDLFTGATATTTAIAAGAMTNVADSVYFLTAGAGAADSTAAAAAAITAGATWTSAANTSYVVLADDNSTSIFKWVEAGTNGAQAAELTLIGTVNAQLTAANIVFA
jgi:hypothetical protein